jgi:hypothetical protein
MALSHSPTISTNGLVFYYDMNNQKKSWIGRPTTNFVNAISTSINRYNNPGFSGSVFNTGQTFRGMPIWETVFIPQDSSFIPRLASTEGFGAFHSMGTSLTVNTRYMASIYFRQISPLQVSGTQGFNNTYSNIAGWGQNGTTTTRYEEDGWIRLYSQYLNTTSTLSDNKFWKITFNTTGVQVGQELRAQWCCPMIEQHDTVYPSTFVNGVRSTTQAILDLRNNTTITANSLTYNNDGTFSFNGSNNGMTVPGTNFSLNQMTIEVWCFSTNFLQNGFLFEKTTNGSVNTQYSLFFNNNSSSNLHYRTYGLSTTDLIISRAGSGVNDNQWNQVVATFDGSIKRIYVNGILRSSSSTLTGTIVQNTTGNAYIGIYGSFAGYPFNGQISNEKIYNRALSAAEIEQNFNALRGRYGI